MCYFYRSEAILIIEFFFFFFFFFLYIYVYSFDQVQYKAEQTVIVILFRLCKIERKSFRRTLRQTSLMFFLFFLFSFPFAISYEGLRKSLKDIKLVRHRMRYTNTYDDIIQYGSPKECARRLARDELSFIISRNV